MENERVIFEKKPFRIVEIEIEVTDFEINIAKGDCFNPKVHTDICEEKLKKEELEFEEKCLSEGLFGYELQKWSGDYGVGFEHVNSCYGFIGAFYESNGEFNHYIVAEMKSEIKKLLKKNKEKQNEDK